MTELGPKEQPNSCAIFNYEIVFFLFFSFVFLVFSAAAAASLSSSSSFYCYYFCCTCFVFSQNFALIFVEKGQSG